MEFSVEPIPERVANAVRAFWVQEKVLLGSAYYWLDTMGDYEGFEHFVHQAAALVFPEEYARYRCWCGNDRNFGPHSH